MSKPDSRTSNGKERGQPDKSFLIPPFEPLPDHWKRIPAEECGETLLCLNDFLTEDMHIVLFPAYYQQGLDNASERMYSRSGVVENLVQAASYLPEGYKLILYDTYRSPETQQALYEREYANMKIKYPNASDENLASITQEFIALPSWDKIYPSPHGSGGAVDLSVLGPDGKPLDMGTPFDDLDEHSHTAYFIESTDPTEKKYNANRQILYTSMVRAGFTNYQGEWWHYDFGNTVWAALKGESKTKYGLPDNPQHV